MQGVSVHTPVNTYREAGTTVLWWARARRVMPESSRMIPPFLCSTRRFAFSITIISANRTWRCRLSKVVDATTSPFTRRCISVTSSDVRQSLRTISTQSVVIRDACAMFCSSMVFGLPSAARQSDRAGRDRSAKPDPERAPLSLR